MDEATTILGIVEATWAEEITLPIKAMVIISIKAPIITTTEEDVLTRTEEDLEIYLEIAILEIETLEIGIFAELADDSVEHRIIKVRETSMVDERPNSNNHSRIIIIIRDGIKAERHSKDEDLTEIKIRWKYTTWM